MHGSRSNIFLLHRERVHSRPACSGHLCISFDVDDNGSAFAKGKQLNKLTDTLISSLGKVRSDSKSNDVGNGVGAGVGEGDGDTVGAGVGEADGEGVGASGGKE